MRARVSGVLAASLVFLMAGCAAQTAPPERDPEGPAPAGTKEVTIHVKDMCKVLNIA
jgi:hypothetical protein